LIFEPASDYVYWVEFNPNNNRLALNAAPVRVGSLVEKYLWHEEALRHPDLRHADRPRRVRLHPQYPDPPTKPTKLALGSPFDYESAALLYIANDIAEPHAPEYQAAARPDAGPALQGEPGGRALVLFTSYAQLKTHRQRTIQAGRFPSWISSSVYEQGEGGLHRTRCLKSFKKLLSAAVLLGTRFLLGGCGRAGTGALGAGDRQAALCGPLRIPWWRRAPETFEDPFNEYHLPEAILRFRQGFGRLIRTQSDRGVVRQSSTGAC